MTLSEVLQEFCRNLRFHQLTRDPSFARAYSGLADTYSITASQSQYWGHQGIMKAKSLAEKALELDDDLPEAHTSIGFILTDLFEWKESERHLRRALELSPSYATSHFWYSVLLMWTGRGNKAIEEARQAEELDPLSPAISVALGQALIYTRHFHEAVEQMEKRVKSDPGVSTHFLLAVSYFFNSMYEKAMTEARTVLASSTSHPRAQTILGASLARMGRLDEAKEILVNLQGSRAQSFLIAMLLIELGNKEMALEVLEKGFQAKEPGFGWITVVPTFDALGSNHRFVKLLREMNLPFEE